MSLKPLLWKVYEKKEKDDNWPKRVIGASLVYLNDTNRYLLIGGNFNAYENLINNFQMNAEIIRGVDKDINDFQKLNSEKISYLTQSVYNNSSPKNIEVYLYELSPGIIIK